MSHLEAKIVLELDAVHDGEHRGRGCAAHKEHLRWCNHCGWRWSWWGSAQCGWWCRRSSPQWRWERAQASSPQGSAEISWEANCTNFARIANAVCQGHLSRWTANKAKSRSWQMEWVWLVDEHLRVEALWAEARSNAAGGLSCELTWDQSDPCESDVDTGYIRDVKTDVSTSCWNCNYRKKAI